MSTEIVEAVAVVSTEADRLNFNQWYYDRVDSVELSINRGSQSMVKTNQYLDMIPTKVEALDLSTKAEALDLSMNINREDSSFPPA